MALKVEEAPVEMFRYKSCNSQLLGYILEAATRQTLSEHAFKKLWAPIGAKIAVKWCANGADEKGYCFLRDIPLNPVLC